MRPIGRFTALTLSTILLAGVPAATFAATAAPAERAVKFGTIKTWSGAKHQACKVAVEKDTMWKVLTRVVNGRKAEVGVGLFVYQDGEVVDEVRTPIMKKGKTSKTLSVKFPKDDDSYTLDAFQFQGQMGDGGPLDIKKIKAC